MQHMQSQAHFRLSSIPQTIKPTTMNASCCSPSALTAPCRPNHLAGARLAASCRAILTQRHQRCVQQHYAPADRASVSCRAEPTDSLEPEDAPLPVETAVQPLEPRDDDVRDCMDDGDTSMHE